MDTLKHNTVQSLSPAGIDTLIMGEFAPDLSALIAKKKDLQTRLCQQGALLFRGFQINTPEQFKRLATIFTNEFMDDNGEHIPLSGVDGVFTPVGFSANEKLLWHNENSFNQTWPLMIMFGAAKVAEIGGETPIADSRKVLDAIDPEVRKEFYQKGIMYVRTHGFGFGRTWQETYRVENQKALEIKLRHNNIQFEWYAKDQLVTKQIRSALIKHPITNEAAWFAQPQHWHPYCLKPEVRASLLSLFPEDRLPRNCYFGDGSIIPDTMMQHILNAYKKVEISFPWETGDVMVLDNVLFAHARNPYSGKRKLFVTMGTSVSF